MQNLLPEVEHLTVSGKPNSSQKLSAKDQESARAAICARDFPRVHLERDGSTALIAVLHTPFKNMKARLQKIRGMVPREE
jgi:hypothetical protein